MYSSSNNPTFYLLNFLYTSILLSTYNKKPSRHNLKGFLSRGGRVGRRYPLLEFPLSDGPRRCNCRTTRDCRSYRSSRTVCRFGRSGNRRGIALRLGCCGRLGLRARSFLGRYKYRYTCRPSQCVGNDGMVFAVGETAQFFAVASVNGGQIAIAVVIVAHQFLTIEGDGSEAVRCRRERRFSRVHPYTI